MNLKHPVKTNVIAGRPLTFSWSTKGVKPAVFSVSLKQIGGPIIFTQSITKNQIRLPDNVQLSAGGRYEWSVVAISDGETSEPSLGRFKVATDLQSSQFYSAYSAEKKTVSDWVLYALQLDEMKLDTESAQIWQQLEAIRPGISSAR